MLADGVIQNPRAQSRWPYVIKDYGMEFWIEGPETTGFASKKSINVTPFKTLRITFAVNVVGARFGYNIISRMENKESSEFIYGSNWYIGYDTASTQVLLVNLEPYSGQYHLMTYITKERGNGYGFAIIKQIEFLT